VSFLPTEKREFPFFTFRSRPSESSALFPPPVFSPPLEVFDVDHPCGVLVPRFDFFFGVFRFFSTWGGSPNCPRRIPPAVFIFFGRCSSFFASRLTTTFFHPPRCFSANSSPPRCFRSSYERSFGPLHPPPLPPHPKPFALLVFFPQAFSVQDSPFGLFYEMQLLTQRPPSFFEALCRLRFFVCRGTC